MSNLDEQQVWSSFVKGDQKSFEQLYHHYYQSLCNYALRIHQDLQLVEEAIQDLFVKLWQNRQNLNAPQSVKHYLFKSLRHTIYNKLQVNDKEIYVGSDNDMLVFEFDIPKEPSDYHQVLLKKLMAELTERQKEAVYLFYHEELSYQEIADILKIKIGGTYKLLYRAIDKMKTQFHHQHHPESPIASAKLPL